MRTTSQKDGQFIYIAQPSIPSANRNNQTAYCKVGYTKNLRNRLKDYQSQSGQSTDVVWNYLYAVEVSDMKVVETDFKKKFHTQRQKSNEEIFFFNQDLYNQYVDFIRNHKLTHKEISITKKVLSKEVIRKKKAVSLKESGDTRVKIINRAKKVDNDEFYTLLEDVEKELNCYDVNIWKDKIVFCNCDDAVGKTIHNESAFARFFINNFNRLKIKKLICTHYSGGVDLFSQGVSGYVFTKDGYTELKDFPKNYNGSFDHPLSISLLNESDIVCTNPPFSRAIDFWKMIVNSKKQFVIISNITNPITTAFIPYFQKKKVWAGYNRIDNFMNDKRQLVTASGHWYTNINIKNRPKHKNLKIAKMSEIPKDCKNIDDSGTLLIDKWIPSDYKKPFAVSCRPILNGILEKGYKICYDKQYIPKVNGKKCFARVLIQKIDK